MAVRTHFIITLVTSEMDAMIQQIKDFCTLKYFTGTSGAELQVDVGNGTIGSISDTRLQAGALN